ncbi:hypothetical protein [Sinanaerobacter chloroacetimidivorans]|uniref:Uncharacterized protein n=1 Tax=Sinanaerobacter chloroacetimidivorans TaxID=2818044 RepID=A0A8J7W246_9FIRM|nr:hypothetical protein [Sinanaerobacter chloroacetimidivorans]MBR0599029.1 hypothetical protein [Sinanaerobacter chloroacetimidivorans]
METIIINARLILLELVKKNQDVNAKKLMEQVSLGQEQTELALQFLVEHGLSKFKIEGKFEYKTVSITPIGRDIAEEWRNEDRWQLVIQVCKQLDNFSYRILPKVLEKIIDADIDKHIYRQKGTLQYE